jgi:putative endonuclease
MPRPKLSIYIVECADGSYYTGVTNDVERRVAQHNDRQSTTGFTSKRLPVKLVFAQQFASPAEALAMEKRVKKWRREKKLALIQGRFEDLPKLAKTARHPSTSSAGGDPKRVAG